MEQNTTNLLDYRIGRNGGTYVPDKKDPETTAEKVLTWGAVGSMAGSLVLAAGMFLAPVIAFGVIANEMNNGDWWLESDNALYDDIF